jgi:hypothetical protein
MEKQLKKTIAHLLSILLIFGALTSGLIAFGPIGFDAYADDEEVVVDEAVHADDLVLVAWEKIGKLPDGHTIRIAFDEDGGNEWEGSDAQAWCTDYYDDLLEDPVGDYIVGVKTSEPNEPYEGVLDRWKKSNIDGTGFDDPADAEPSDLNKVFFLSAYEYYENCDYIQTEDFTKHRNLDGWLLRSAAVKEGYSLIGIVRSAGEPYYAYPQQADCTVIPAMYVKKSFFEEQLNVVSVEPGTVVNFSDRDWVIMENPEGIRTYDDLLDHLKEIWSKVVSDGIGELIREGDYDEEGKEALQAICTNALNALEEAKTKAEVEEIVTAAALAVANDVETITGAKEAAQEDLKEFFDSIDQSEYDAANVKALEDANEAGKEAIEGSTTTAGAHDAADNAIKVLDAIQTVEEAKETAMDALNECFDLLDPLDYDDAGWDAIEEAYKAGEEGIGKAETNAEAYAASGTAIEALENVETVPEAKEAAKKDLEDYFKSIDKSKYDDAGKAALDAAYKAGQDAIEAAKTTDGAKAAGTSAKSSLDAVKTVGTVKADAEKALDDYAKTKDPANYDEAGKVALNVAITNGRNTIEAAKSAAEVNAALINAKATMDAVTQVIVDLKAVKIKSAKSAKESAKVTWKKVSKKNRQNTQYVEIQYSPDKTFRTDVETKLVKSKKTNNTLKVLESKKKYYVRVRAYTKVGNVLHVSKWSKKKSAKIK